MIILLLYIESDHFVTIYSSDRCGTIYRYHSTIRSNGCQLLIKYPGDISVLSEDDAKESYRCDECSRMRINVLSMRGWHSS